MAVPFAGWLRSLSMSLSKMPALRGWSGPVAEAFGNGGLIGAELATVGVPGQNRLGPGPAERGADPQDVFDCPLVILAGKLAR